jgi:hypothetical protein
MKMPDKDIEKIGFPDSEESYPKGFNMNQSAGLPESGSKDAQRIQTIANKMQPYDYPGDSSPLHAAHAYIQLLREHPDGIDMGTHMEGHHAIGTVHNILNHGEEYSYHPDSIQYKIEEPQEERGAGLNDNMTLEGFHRNHLRANMRTDMSHNAMGLADDLHRRLRQVSPAFNPDSLGYNPLQWPASMTRSFADSAPLPPEGEGDNIRGEMKPQFPTDPQPGPHSDFKGYDRGEAWPKERYGRENRARRGDAAMESGHHSDTAEYRYPSMRGRRETYRTMGGELEEPSANPSANPSAETPVSPQPKAKNAFKQRFPDLFGDEEKAVSKLMKFIKAEEDDGIEGFRRHMGDEIQRQVDKNRPHTEWEDTHPDLFLPVGHDKAPLFLENKGEGRPVPSVHYHAYNYLDKIHRDVPMTANQHADGLKGVHRSDMLQRHGAAVRDMDYDDAFPLGRARPNRPPRNAPKGQRPSQEYLDTTRKEMNIHDFLTDHTESMLSKVPSQHQEGVQRMFDKVAFESPSYKPTGSFETDPDIQRYFSVSKLMKFIRKEGEGGGDGGAFNGLSGTVFTSTNAGVFTPTFGGRGTKKRHLKNKRRQDKKREKLMGKSKKSGVDRLVQFLYDGSPNMSKGGKKGLAPGLDEDMSGAPATADAYNQNITPYQRLSWEKDVTEDTLNHKKTSRKLEDAMEVAEKNEPHINMGLAGGMEAAIAAPYPQEEDPSVSNGTTERKPGWHNKTYVQKASTEGAGNNTPDQNSQAATGPHPQALFVERTKDNPNEAPHKDAVTKENDMQRRRKQESNTEPEGSKPVAGLGLQMAYTSDYGQTDALHRGGDQDTDDPEVSDEDASTYWVPETGKVAKLEAMRKALEEAGDDAPILNALLKVDYA